MVEQIMFAQKINQQKKTDTNLGLSIMHSYLAVHINARKNLWI